MLAFQEEYTMNTPNIVVVEDLPVVKALYAVADTSFLAAAGLTNTNNLFCSEMGSFARLRFKLPKSGAQIDIAALTQGRRVFFVEGYNIPLTFFADDLREMFERLIARGKLRQQDIRITSISSNGHLLPDYWVEILLSADENFVISLSIPLKPEAFSEDFIWERAERFTIALQLALGTRLGLVDIRNAAVSQLLRIHKHVQCYFQGKHLPEDVDFLFGDIAKLTLSISAENLEVFFYIKSAVDAPWTLQNGVTSDLLKATTLLGH